MNLDNGKTPLMSGIVSLRTTLPYRRGALHMTMINQTPQENQLPKEIQVAFKELKILQHLRNAGIKKRFGFSCTYLFQIVFCLIFYHRNWYCLLESPKGETLPGKDTIYRFLNHTQFSWRRFLSNLSSNMLRKLSYNHLNFNKGDLTTLINFKSFKITIIQWKIYRLRSLL